MTEAGQEPHRSLLIIDDDSLIRVLLHTALQRHYDVLCVPNGLDVPGVIASRKPDLIVLDIHLPGSDNFELCAGIRDQAALQRAPILFMTVCRDERGFFESLKTNGNSYIRKPFKIPELKRKIEGMLNPAPQSGPI